MVLYEYDSYEDYKETQTRYNKNKIEQVWADEETLNLVAGRVNEELRGREAFGICHGSRNGFEQQFLAKKIAGKIIGTDISETAANYPDSVQWDFHEPNPEWNGKCDFVYTNSLDQSWQPKKALETWLEQLNDCGVLIIEHTVSHGPQSASKMDRFGVKPKYMPYLLSEWFELCISIEIIESVKANYGIPVWLFVIRRNGPRRAGEA